MRLQIHYRLLVIVLVFTFTLYAIHRYISAWRIDIHDDDLEPKTKVQNPFSMNVPLLQFFHVRDAIDINWSHANSPDDVKTLEKQMITTTIRTKDEVKLWLDTVRDLHQVGLKLHFQNLQILEPCLHYLYDIREDVHFPVIVHGDVDLSTSTDTRSASKSLNAQLYFFKLRTSHPDIRFSIGHAPVSSNDLVQMNYVKELQEHIKHFSQSTFITVCASMVKQSWRPLRWLLENSDNLSLIITNGGQFCTYVPQYDLLFVRNDWKPNRIFFEIPETIMVDFRSISATAGNPLHFFGVTDAMDITWAHRVNKKVQLMECLKGSTMFIEADLILQVNSDGSAVPVMAHPPETSSDLTFQEWLDMTVTSGKGMKLDFKTIQVVEPALNILRQKHHTIGIKQPVWLNADILPGPNMNQGFVDSEKFLRLVDSLFPASTVSIGFTTKWNNDGSGNVYTDDMVKKMDAISKHIKQPITIPVRASMVKKSWEHFDWLLKQSRGYTLTIWTKWPMTDSEAVSVNDMEFIRNNTEPSRVYFDLPKELMPPSINH